MSQTATELRVVLGNVFAFYYRTHSFHWNVTGILFHPMHQFFDHLYNELWSSIDPIAEQIRTLNELAPGTFPELLTPATITFWSVSVPGTNKEMLFELTEHNERVLQSLYAAHTAALSEKHHGLANFIQDRIDKHAKIQWQLKAHLPQGHLE